VRRRRLLGVEGRGRGTVLKGELRRPKKMGFFITYK
jgi:hypothetical protein